MSLNRANGRGVPAPPINLHDRLNPGASLVEKLPDSSSD
jgi:hypothetical protein